MSHVATIDIEIRDLDALQEACGRVGLELVRDQKTYRWYGVHAGDYPVPAGFAVEDLGQCEHAVRIPGDAGAYEIGVVKRRDGRPGYTLIWDFWCGGWGIEAKAGRDCNKLRQAYALVVAKRAALKQGFSVSEQRVADGSYVLRCAR
jgi:uncharacterized protein DUF1257